MAEDVIVVVQEDDHTVIVSAPGPPGPQGPTGPAGGSRFEHTQGSPSSSWVIVHNLNTYPSVVIKIGNDNVEADVTYNSVNSLTISFNTPQSGLAVLS